MILYTLFAHWGSRVGALVGGFLIVAVGVYFFLRNAFGYAIPDINWDLVWPVVVIVTGLAILSRAIHKPTSATSDDPGDEVFVASGRPGEAD